MPACRYMEENGLAAIQVTKRLAGITLEVNLREYGTCMSPPSANKAAHSGFETRGDVTISPKQGCQWPHKKGLNILQIFFKSKIRLVQL